MFVRGPSVWTGRTLQAKSDDIPPAGLDAHLKEKCGFQEDQEEREFVDFIGQQIARAVPDKMSKQESAETVAAIMIHISLEHPSTGIRRFALEAYAKSTPK